MTAELTAASLVVALADLALIAACWKSRTVLGGVLGASGVALVVLSVAGDASGPARESSIAIAALTLVIGSVLYALGQALERLLDNQHDAQ